MKLTVEEVSPTTVQCVGGYEFCVETGSEIDHEIGWGPMYGHSGSYLVKESQV